MYFVSRNPLYTRFRSDRANVYGDRKIVRLLNATTINTIPRSVISETKLNLELLPNQTEAPFLHKIAEVKTTKKELHQQMIGVELKLKNKMKSCNLEVKQYMHNDRNEPLRERGHQIEKFIDFLKSSLNLNSVYVKDELVLKGSTCQWVPYAAVSADNHSRYRSH